MIKSTFIITFFSLLFLLSCESKKDKVFRLLTNDSEAYWELKSVSCIGKPLPFKHKLVLSFSIDSTSGEYWWHGKYYSSHNYYRKKHPPTTDHCGSFEPTKYPWGLLNENMLLIVDGRVRILSLTKDTLILYYPKGTTCRKRTFVRMRNSGLVKKED